MIYSHSNNLSCRSCRLLQDSLFFLSACVRPTTRSPFGSSPEPSFWLPAFSYDATVNHGNGGCASYSTCRQRTLPRWKERQMDQMLIIACNIKKQKVCNILKPHVTSKKTCCNILNRQVQHKKKTGCNILNRLLKHSKEHVATSQIDCCKIKKTHVATS